jgi:hypothetical protein
MNAEIFALCDAANDSHGKLNLLGAFDTVWAATVPAIHAACAVAVRMRFDRHEHGDHAVAIHLIDDDGQMVLPPLQGTIQINPSPDDSSAVANIVLNLQGVHLPHFGEYSVNLLVDDEEITCIPLFVRAAHQ